MTRTMVPRKQKKATQKKTKSQKSLLTDGSYVSFRAPVTDDVIEGIAIETTHRCDFNKGCGPKCYSHGRPRQNCVVVITTPLTGYGSAWCLYPMRSSYKNFKLVERVRLNAMKAKISDEELASYKNQMCGSLMPPHAV